MATPRAGTRKPPLCSMTSRSRASSPNSSRCPATLDWTSVLATLLGYAIAAFILVLPVVALVLLTRGAWFGRNRRRVRWAGERLLWWRDPMSDLGKFGEDPEEVKRRR